MHALSTPCSPTALRESCSTVLNRLLQQYPIQLATCSQPAEERLPSTEEKQSRRVLHDLLQGLEVKGVWLFWASAEPRCLQALPNL